MLLYFNTFTLFYVLNAHIRLNILYAYNYPDLIKRRFLCSFEHTQKSKETLMIEAVRTEHYMMVNVFHNK